VTGKRTCLSAAPQMDRTTVGTRELIESLGSIGPSYFGTVNRSVMPTGRPRAGSPRDRHFRNCSGTESGHLDDSHSRRGDLPRDHTDRSISGPMMKMLPVADSAGEANCRVGER